MRRRQRQEDLVPVDLRVFQLDAWLRFVPADAKLPDDDPRTCSDEHYRRTVARLLWVRARTAWAQQHPWPGDSLAKLREERDARRAIEAAYYAERGDD